MAAASDLQFALEELIEEFEGENPGTEVEASYGSSGNLYSELVNGAPFDIFFSASPRYVAELERLGLLEPGTRKRYARGHLVIWFPSRLGIEPELQGPAALLDSRVERIVVANPQHAPYGQAAVAFLERTGLLDRLERKLVYGENASQAAQIALQAGQVGIIALSLASSPRMEQAGSSYPIPATEQLEIEQEYAILLGHDRPEVRRFFEFVQSDRAGEVFADFGFGPP